jgi:hypothetical protein
MKPFIPLVALLILSGCTTWALRQTTLSQAESSTDLRYREIIDNLAMIYANPDALPAYASIYTGAADINDNLKFTTQAIWTRTNPAAGYMTAFAAASADVLGSRAEKGTWTLDPTIVPEKLRAMRAACRWALFGPEAVGPDVRLLKRYEPPQFKGLGHSKSTAPDVLLKPFETPQFGIAEPSSPKVYVPGDPPGIYFDVVDRLGAIRPGWLHCEGCRSAIPRTACYWQGCHGKYVWVGPDGMEGLSQFMLVIQGIARVHYDTLHYPRPRTREVVKNIVIDAVNPNEPAGPGERLHATVTVYLDDDGNVTPGDGKPAIPPKVRNDNVGQNSDLKSIISATAKSP